MRREFSKFSSSVLGASITSIQQTIRARSKVIAAAKPLCAALHQFSSNDRALDLIGALIYLGDLGVAIEALYLEALDITGAAKNLDSVGGLGNGHVAGEALRHRGRRRRRDAAVDHQRRALDKGAGYGPMFDHFGFSCGMEVVLGNGEVLRTGDGSIDQRSASLDEGGDFGGLVALSFP